MVKKKIAIKTNPRSHRYPPSPFSDTLMGMERKAKAVKPSSRIERRIKSIATLAPRANREIVQLIDS
jgi:hypothetical protein